MTSFREESPSQSPRCGEWKKCPVVKKTGKIPQKAKAFYKSTFRNKETHTLSL